MNALRHVLAATPLASIASLQAAHDFARRAAAGEAPTIERAILGGFAADRLGFAFAVGYDAALRALVPDLAAGETAAFCATEDAGAHPRAIAARLDERDAPLVDGTKRFATLATIADRLVVVASVGAAEDGRNRLRAAVIDARAPGVRVTPLSPPPFAPEIPHAEVRFERTPVLRVLPGDGYERYLKPFRTIEDVHVLGATLGYLVSVARRAAWPRPVLAEIAALVTSTAGIARDDPGAPEAHVALGGVFTRARALLAETAPLWPEFLADERDRWTRDRPLLDVASRAREQRLEAAFRALSAG